ncbi:MAG TPA: DUF1918 domain-containing protein [Intrasporangium sp.]|uniref:DUF1918 domain-containing protein n=1 Tax=Intrasporangium sp. TaxID=1925024 RepID=UPI002D79EDDF|nr:DUF1918 domain-containing protein [Intrasporangium sp.]HET7397185.1 DUF1918 domain-containing protein [Intrasporangium sp.]
MRAQVGDRIILAAEHIDEPTRDGEILEVRGAEGSPPYLVRWSSGHTGLIYPGPGAVLRIGAGPDAQAATPAPPAPSPAPAAGHVREWQVRISIFESGDDTSANVVLISDSPQHLSARGSSHRSAHDDPAPQIGDEVAVARALRHLADKLVATAEGDIGSRMGAEAHVRPV